MRVVSLYLRVRFQHEREQGIVVMVAGEPQLG